MKLSSAERALLLFALACLATACGLFAGRIDPNAPEPDGAREAVATVLNVFDSDLGRTPEVESVTWIFEDQCGIGHPSIKWGTECLAGLALGCDLYVAVTTPISDGALAHEVSHCAGRIHGRSEQLFDWEKTIWRANNALRAKGL